MRVLYLDYTNAIGLGGGQRSLNLLMRHLSRARYEPVLACPPDEKLREILDPTVRVLDLNLPARFRSVSRNDASLLHLPATASHLWGTVQQLKKMVAAERIDLIHANNLKMALLAALAAPSLPMVWHVRDIFPGRQPVMRLLQFASRAATKVLAVSQAVAHHLPDRSKTEVLYNAVELPPVEAAAPSRRTPPVFGFVGRLDAWKGIRALADAFAIVRRAHPEAELLVAGEGPEAAVLNGRAGITQLGFQKNLAEVFSRIDVAVTPSIEPDPFPRAVIEAMSYGRPVVGAAAGGIPEAIAHDDTGLLVTPGSVEELAAAMARFSREPELVAALGAA
ncbi:MAG: glycosyltransferase family 4 protein, partial [Bryobacterales bacterium]|nr:glycosyltransferase family 4 protein [Bryobacterales bacterium]